tara:strand:+ start:18 stop:539 length:522 start_codon:yes stop_codon:yes gene_type:complete
MKLYLKLRGEQGHNWPILNIKQDGVFQKFEIIEFQEIDIDLDNAPFTLGMYNKLFGKNRIWDTKVDREGNIIADKIIWIERFEIDEVDIIHLLPKLSYNSIEQGFLTINDKCIRFNGNWSFDIGENPYDWIIDTNTKKTNEYRDTSYFSDFTILNNYTEHYHYINKIKKILGI